MAARAGECNILWLWKNRKKAEKIRKKMLTKGLRSGIVSNALKKGKGLQWQGKIICRDRKNLLTKAGGRGKISKFAARAWMRVLKSGAKKFAKDEKRT